VVRIDLSQNATYTGGAQTDFVTGFLAPGAKESEAIGRPVDVYIEPGGVMYISDDRAGAVYRIARTSLD
jgi:glucose/arabinose dehydrogenase